MLVLNVKTSGWTIQLKHVSMQVQVSGRVKRLDGTIICENEGEYKWFLGLGRRPGEFKCQRVYKCILLAPLWHRHYLVALVVDLDSID